MSADQSSSTPHASVHEWDGAYVLGALSPEDRRTFEAHLEECAECRASVAELAGIPALLSRVPAPEADFGERARAESTLMAGRESMLPALARRARLSRLRRGWAATGAAVLAAAAIVAAVVAPMRLDAPPQPTTSIALAQSSPSPLTATVGLTAQSWGTTLTMTCRYAPSGASSGYGGFQGRYALYVTDASGTATLVASWSAWPGATIHASGAVDLTVPQLRTVQVRDLASGAVLLSAPVK